jgi:hypothetical protein
VRENCSDDFSNIQGISMESLSLYDVNSVAPVLEPNWPLIIGLSSSFAILIFIGILLFLWWDPFGWEVFSTKRFRARYKELSQPYLPPKYKSEDEKTPLFPFAIDSNSSELEDFNVKHFVDKLR